MKKLLLFCSLLTATFTPIIAQNVGTKLIREDRIWQYRGLAGAGHADYGYEYMMKFDGTTEIDGVVYHKLKTFDGAGYRWNGPSSDAVRYEISDAATFLLREENGKVFRHAPLEEYSLSNVMWAIEENEALIYDFNVEDEDSMTIVDSEGGLIEGIVTHTSSMTVNNDECKSYNLKFDNPDFEYTVIEGIGNINSGCLPYFDIDRISGGSNPSFVPAPCHDQSLSKVFDADGNIIYVNENGIDSWPWELNSVDSIKQGVHEIIYSEAVVTVADGAGIAVYDMAGKRVAQGHGPLSTASLLPGVYIVKAGASTLKITVK